jgi:para-nitrobenzyl esterase
MFGGEEAGRHAVEVYRAGRPGASPAELLFAMDGDRCVRIPAIRLAEAHPGPVWSYLLTLEGTGMGTVMGAAHALEIPFVFDNLEAQDVETMLGPVTDDGRKLASRMGDAWVAFAADGRPSLSGGPDWPAYKAETRMVMELAAEHRVLSDPHGTERALWDHLA